MILFPLIIKWPDYAYATVLTIIFSIIVMYFADRKLKEIKMIEALNSNEWLKDYLLGKIKTPTNNKMFVGVYLRRVQDLNLRAVLPVRRISSPVHYHSANSP